MSTPGGSLAGQTFALIDLLDARATSSPHHTFLVDERGRRITFAEFRRESIRVAERLGKAGIGPHSLVSWVLPTSIDALVVSAALSRLGATQNPIIPVYREREIGHILDHTPVDLMIVTPQWRGIDYLSLCSDLAAARGGRPMVLTIEDVMRDGAPVPAVGRRTGHHEVSPAQWLFFTSGTGGLPKGVRHTDRSLVAAAAGMVDHLAITEDDRSGIAFPIAHIGGPINLMAGLLSGASLILIEQLRPRDFGACARPTRGSRWPVPGRRSTSRISTSRPRSPMCRSSPPCAAARAAARPSRRDCTSGSSASSAGAASSRAGG